MSHYGNSIHEVSGFDVLFFTFIKDKMDGLKCQYNLEEHTGSSSRFCLAKILGVNNEGKGIGLSLNVYFGEQIFLRVSLQTLRTETA